MVYLLCLAYGWTVIAFCYKCIPNHEQTYQIDNGWMRLSALTYSLSEKPQMQKAKHEREIEMQSGPMYAAGEYATCPRINQYMTCFAWCFCFCRCCHSKLLDAATFSFHSWCMVSYGVCSICVWSYCFICFPSARFFPSVFLQLPWNWLSRQSNLLFIFFYFILY